MPKYPTCPHVIKGNLEISKRHAGIFIGGDANGLRSLAKMLTWLADVDQELHPTMPEGEREHLHLYPNPPYNHLTPFSIPTELCRLDAKGTGVFPEYYRSKRKLSVRGKKKPQMRRKKLE